MALQLSQAVGKGTVYLLSSDGAALHLGGAALPGEILALAQELRGSRPAARKAGGGMIVVAPAGATAWMVRYLTQAPGGDLAKFLHSQTEDAALLVSTFATGAQGEIGSAQPSLVDQIIEAAARAATAPKRARTEMFLAELAATDGLGLCILLRVKGGKVRRIWWPDQDLSDARDELRVVVEDLLASGQLSDGKTYEVAQDTTEEVHLSAALLTRKMEAKRLQVRAPGSSGDGIVAVVLDASPQVTQLPDIPSLAALAQTGRIGRGGTDRLWIKRLLQAAVVGAIVVGLSWPVPLRITSTGQTIPASAVVAALPSGGYLDRVLVRPGAQVTKGQELATFSSPDLDQQRAEQELALLVEKIDAQEALAEGDYGRFQISEQRAEIAALRLEQINQKISLLTVTAPADGRVTDAIPSDTRGSFHQPGSTIAEIQDGPGFTLVMDIAPVDAPLIKDGQTGQVYFRGISDLRFPVEVNARPAQRVDPSTGDTFLEYSARVTAEDQDRLLTGLSGFARITVGQEPAAYALTRYAIEFVKVTVWKYLGWHV